jgi:hypothetical protein
MTEPTAQKGENGGECGRLLCCCSPARWFHSIEKRFVCEGCAYEENLRSWRNQWDGSPCCHVATEAARLTDREQQIEAASAVFQALHARMRP